MKEYKGIDLLDKILEFSEIEPDSNRWNLKALGDPPLLVRLKQINALISAFFNANTPTNFLERAKNFFHSDKKETIHTVLYGDFLKNQDIGDFSELIELMTATVKAPEKFKRDEPEIDISDLITLFQNLIRYKKELRRFLKFNSGTLGANSITSRFSLYLTNSISNNLADKYSELDSALELCINPQKLSFTEDELIAKFNFPTDNLQEIDDLLLLD